jgi:glutaminase
MKMRLAVQMLFVALPALTAACASPIPARDAALPVTDMNTTAQTTSRNVALSETDKSNELWQQQLEAVVANLRSNRDGQLYSAAIEATNPDDLAIAVALVDGRQFMAGDAASSFPLMSVSKPFTYALAVEQRGAAFMLDKIGVSATGLPYNSVAAGAVRRTSEQNPMVNAGAIATHSYIDGLNPGDKTRTLVEFYSSLANRPLSVNEEWRVKPRAQTYTLAYQMKAAERLQGDVEDVVARYLESNIVAVNVGELAQMGSTLANGGIQPTNRQRVMQQETVQRVLSAMVIAGMYEDSGHWWARVGMPAKSGVSGAILAIAPGWGAIAAYSPRLDAAGNSIRAALAIEELSQLWNLHSIERLILAPSTVPGR